jgi:hypothetical protein
MNIVFKVINWSILTIYRHKNAYKARKIEMLRKDYFKKFMENKIIAGIIPDSDKRMNACKNSWECSKLNKMI